MEYLHLYIKLYCVLLSIFGFVHALHCNDQQKEVNGQCCNSCPAGFYLKDFCSSGHNTRCEPCHPGWFSDKPSFFDQCKQCLLCEQEYTENCTATTDAKCLCRPGFLCSNTNCSKCEKDNCVIGESLKRTVNVNDSTKWTYECEPKCQDHEYYNEKKNICIPQTSCSDIGLIEVFAGNKTHNSICQPHGMPNIFAVVISGFVLLCVIFVLFLYLTVKRIKKIKVSKTRAVAASEICPLSKEETGLVIEQKVDKCG